VRCHNVEPWVFPYANITELAKVEPVENCTKEIDEKFIYENIITMFGFLVTIISDQGTHFINRTIEVILKKF
jgi:hypothetical protein